MKILNALQRYSLTHAEKMQHVWQSDAETCYCFQIHLHVRAQTLWSTNILLASNKMPYIVYVEEYWLFNWMNLDLTYQKGYLRNCSEKICRLKWW